MNQETHVKEISIFEECCSDIVEMNGKITDTCQKGMWKAENALNETEVECRYSEDLLEEARIYEAQCMARVHECEAEVASAAAGLPYTSAWYAEAVERLAIATCEYEKAVQHRKRMEHRVELARECVKIADEMVDHLKTRFRYSQNEIQNVLERGLNRMAKAYGTLSKYSLAVVPAENMPQNHNVYQANSDIHFEKIYKPNSNVTIAGKRYRTDDLGRIYQTKDPKTNEYRLLPNIEYNLNGYHYKTDKYGRIISASGTLGKKMHDGRKTINDSVKGMHKKDERGHLLADQFDGSNLSGNLVAMRFDLNRNDYKRMEEKWAEYLKNNKSVDVDIEMKYRMGSNRPYLISVKYTVDGELFKETFMN